MDNPHYRLSFHIDVQTPETETIGQARGLEQFMDRFADEIRRELIQVFARKLDSGFKFRTQDPVVDFRNGPTWREDYNASQRSFVQALGRKPEDIMSDQKYATQIFQIRISTPGSTDENQVDADATEIENLSLEYVLENFLNGQIPNKFSVSILDFGIEWSWLTDEQAGRIEPSV